MARQVMRRQEALRFAHLVLTCSDGRGHGTDCLSSQIRRHIGDARPYDLLAIPGACYGLMRGTAAEQALHLDYIKLLVDAHQPETVIILPHLGCARYHGNLILNSEEEEWEVLTEDVRGSARLLRLHLPHVRVLSLIAVMDDRRITRLKEVSTADFAGARASLRNSTADESAVASEQPSE